MKKTRSMLAVLICLTLLVSLCAVNVSAAETVTSSVDFTTLPVTDAGDPTKAVMEGAGLIIPEGSQWQIVDHFYHVAIPKEGYQKTYYIQTLDAGEGRVFAEDAVLDFAYMLAATNLDGSEYDVGWVVVYVSTDGENFTEAYVDEEGQGKMYDPSAVVATNFALPGTAGASKIWIKVEVERHAGESSGAIGWTKLSGTAIQEGEVSVTADFTSLTPTAAGADSNAAMEALGVEVPEGSDWHVVDHFGFCIIPKEGYQKTYFIQTLEAGEGKVFAEDASMHLSYAMAALDDPSFLVIYVSVDGENYTEIWVDEEGSGAMYDASAFHEATIALTGTAGASKIWVKVELERHAGETSGLIKTSTLSGVAEAAEVDPDPTEPPATEPQPTEPQPTETQPSGPSQTGDSGIVFLFMIMAMACAAGVVISAAKVRKEN